MQTTLDTDRIREIVASFAGAAPSDVHSGTRIDRHAIRSSVLLHRMYARLAQAGLNIPAGQRPQIYGELFTSNDEAASEPAPASQNVRSLPSAAGPVAIGIDIEDVSSMPEATDFRTDAFYTRNFSSAEIAHCILQANPRQSFAGRFCVKEAIVKADNYYRDIPFNQIEIQTGPAGQPVFEDFSLSISHTDDKVVAVAVRVSLDALIVRS